MGRYVVGSLAVVGTLGEPAFDRLTVSGRVVVVATLETEPMPHKIKIINTFFNNHGFSWDWF